MAANLFKTRYIPNADATDSAVAATNANTAFVHTYLGDDNTGDGTRSKPFRTINRAMQKSTISFIVFRGVINEYFINNIPIIGDDINQNIVVADYLPILGVVFQAGLDRLTFFNYQSNKNSCIIRKTSINSAEATLRRCLFIGAIMQDKNTRNIIHQSTVSTLKYTQGSANIKNSILEKCLFLHASGNQNFNSSVLLSSINIGLFNKSIVQPKWTDDSGANVTLLREALTAAGITLAYSNIFFPKDSFGNETCLVIKESRSGGSRPNVFNRYTPNITGTLDAPITANTAKTSITLTVADASKVPDTGDFFIPFIGTYTNNGASITDGNEVFTYTSKTINSPTSVTLNGASYTFNMPHSAGVVCTRYGDVLDYTLNPDVRNEALYASDTGGYVGCFAPAVKKEFSTFTAPANVNADGTDAGNGGDLMQFNDADGLTFNNASAQTWNRIRTTQIIEIQRGQTFKGLNVMSQDGSPFGYYVGKHQNLIGTDKILAGGNLTAGKIYKIFNDTAKDTTRSIIYNGVNYFPEYTLVCVAGALSFAEINPGSGTYVREVLADVLESIEVLPYDNETTPSAFPRFSAPLMGESKLILYTATGAARYGKAIGAPVLFSHLKEANFIADFGAVNDKIAYYDSFAVSNADQEFYRLTNAELNATLKGYFKTDIPLLKYLHLEINGHFDEPYDY